MQIRIKLVTSFLIIALVGGVVGYVGFVGVNNMFEIFHVVTSDTALELSLLGEIETLTQKLQLEAIGYFILAVELEKLELEKLELEKLELEKLEELKEFEETNLILDKKIDELKILQEPKNLSEREEIRERKLLNELVLEKSDLYNTSMKLIEISDTDFDPLVVLTLKEELEQIEENIENIISQRISQEKEELERREIIADQLSMNSSNLILIVSMFGVLFAIIFGLLISNSITSSIKKLQNASEQIIKGNLNVETKIDSKDEIGELSKSFEFMVENLKKMTDMEEQLAIQKNLRMALDESSIVSKLDVDGNIIFVNDKFCKVSKYSREELIGKNQNILRSGVHSSVFYVNLWKIISSGNIWNGEVCNKAKDGTLFWNETTIVPFFDKHGNIYEYVDRRHVIRGKFGPALFKPG